MTNNTQIKVQEIANKVIKRMEELGDDWIKPFHDRGKLGGNLALPHNLSGRNYSGINLFILTMFNEFGSNTWATYKQINEAGGQVLKGEKASTVFYYGSHITTKTDDNGNTHNEGYKFLKTFSVFNIEQTTLEADKIKIIMNRKPKNLVERIEDVEKYIANTQAKVVLNTRGRCFYVPEEDYINMSPLDSWKATPDQTKQEAYYSTLLHELVHWTGNKKRKDRFEKLSYAEEELVAELGSAILSAMLGISKKPSDQHAKYLNNWIQAIKDKPKALFDAVAHSQKAISFIEDLQPKEEKQQSKIEKVA